MRIHVAIVFLCFAMAPLACGGSELETSAGGTNPSQGDKTQQQNESISHEPEVLRSKVPKIGNYGHEGPFAAISGGNGNRKPHIDPADRPAPKRMLTRELKVGNGPVARFGDEVGIYYAGAVYETGKLRYHGWPPGEAPTFELGSGVFGRPWEGGIEGMRVGGIREVVAPSSFFGGTGAVDYVIEMVSLAPASRSS